MVPVQHPSRFRKVERLFGDELYFENFFPVKTRDIPKIEKILVISVFGCENKENYPNCVYKIFWRKTC